MSAQPGVCLTAVVRGFASQRDAHGCVGASSNGVGAQGKCLLSRVCLKVTRSSSNDVGAQEKCLPSRVCLTVSARGYSVQGGSVRQLRKGVGARGQRLPSPSPMRGYSACEARGHDVAGLPLCVSPCVDSTEGLYGFVRCYRRLENAGELRVENAVFAPWRGAVLQARELRRCFACVAYGIEPDLVSRGSMRVSKACGWLKRAQRVIFRGSNQLSVRGVVCLRRHGVLVSVGATNFGN